MFGIKYRYRDLKPGDTYYSAWQEYRKRLGQTWGYFLTMIILIPTLVYLGRCGFGDNVIGTVFILWCVPAWVLNFRLYLCWRCPRCGDTFDSSMNLFKYNSPYRATCVHCGLPKWAPDDPDTVKDTPLHMSSTILGRTKILEQIEATPDAFRELGVSEVFVSFGEGCLGGPDDRDASKPVSVDQIVSIVENSILSDVYVLGGADLNIVSRAPEIDVHFCHHGDIHVTAQDTNSLSAFEKQWKANDVRGYIQQDEQWVRFDGKVFSHPEADPESGHRHT